jgi:Cu(I)/Ag(I) efflux system membrane fusion protein
MSDSERRPSTDVSDSQEERDTAPEAPESDIPDPERIRPVVPLVLFGMVIGAALILAATTFGPALLKDSESETMAEAEANHEGHEESPEEVWTCPMHPFVVSDRPGACPVCSMDLVLRTSSTGLDPVELARLGRVAISPVERVLANVATVPVGRTDLTTDIRAFGRVVYDETSYATIPAWVGGRVERLYVEETGTEVDRGQRLLSIYSPDLLAAQEEYLVILRTGRVSESLVQPAERRLRLLGMSSRQIRRLADRGETSDTISVYAPATGMIVERLVQEGEYVSEGQALYRLAGTENNWVEADVYEQNVPYVSEGMQADVELAAFPGETFSGIVTLVWPFLDTDTRTLRLRTEFESVDPRFRAGMYATVNLSAQVVSQAIVVPAEAVIRTGERSVVYVEIEENLFERQEVELGYRSGDLFEILSGLDVGEDVVARGGFLIDSEAQLYAGGQSLHFGHTAEEQGTTTQSHRDHFDETPVGDYFCPTDPSEQSTEPGRCSENNIAMVQRQSDSHFDPYADPLSFVHPSEWYCPMGAEWVSSEQGRCPICGMNLIEMTDDGTSESSND